MNSRAERSGTEVTEKLSFLERGPKKASSDTARRDVAIVNYIMTSLTRDSQSSSGSHSLCSGYFQLQ